MTDFYKCLSSRFTRWVVEEGFLKSNFVVLDVGVQGGHHPRWNYLGDRLELYGFDALGEEIEALRGASDNPKFHYLEMALGDRDGEQPFFVTESRWSSSFYRPPPSGNASAGRPDDGVLERKVVTRRIDTLIADGTVPAPDYIKMDVEGHEPKVIEGARDLLQSGQVLALESESGFTAFPDAPLSHFALISEPMHELGFYLYNLGLLHATKPPMAAGRPRLMPDEKLYFAPLGRPQTIDVLFSRDLPQEDWSAVPRSQIADRVIKMTVILELYNLQDCAIELLQFAKSKPDLRASLPFPIDDALDRLVPVEEGVSPVGDILNDTQSPMRMDFATFQALSAMKVDTRPLDVVLTPENDVRVPESDSSTAVFTAPQVVEEESPDTPISGANPPMAEEAPRTGLAGRFLERFRIGKNFSLPDGSAVRRNGDLVGWVDSVSIGSGFVRVAGWAADSNRDRGVEKIIVFADGRQVAEVIPDQERADVSAILSISKVVHTGFSVELPKRHLGTIEGLALRLFATVNGEMSELRYQRDYPFRTEHDPQRAVRRASEFVDRLLADAERRDANSTGRSVPSPRPIILDPKRDTQALLDAHVPTHTDAADKEQVLPQEIPRDGLATMVIFGQSNAANHGDTRYSPRERFYNFDFLSGKFYVAKDPLLGASGDLGSFATRLGDGLLENRLYGSVLLAPLALGGSTVAEWSPDGFAHRRILVAVQKMRNHGFNPTHLLWHQGESDASLDTSQADYESSFNHLVASLRDHGILAPVYVAVASRCGNDGSDAVRSAQRAVVNPDYNIFAGPDTDTLGSAYRFDDCHFSERGLQAHAELWLDILKKPGR